MEGWRNHYYYLKAKSKYSCIKLKRACEKYGLENLRFKILEFVEPDKCLEREQYYINFYNSYEDGYNGRPIAENRLGMKHDEETKRKQSERQSQKSRQLTPKILSLFFLGVKVKNISLEVSLSVSVVRKILKENNIKLTKKIPHAGTNFFQYSLDGILIKKWDSVKAASRELHLSCKTIQACLDKKATNVKFIFSKPI